MYYTYVIYDGIRKRFYVGFTKDLQQRLLEHKKGTTHTTYRMVEHTLVYYEACISKKDAEDREKQLKTGFGRGYLKRRLKNYFVGA